MFGNQVRGLLILLFLSLSARQCFLSAEETASEKPAKSETAKEAKPEGSNHEDPFKVSEKIKEEGNKKNGNHKKDPKFKPVSNGLTIPTLKLKGYAEAKEGAKFALLEIGDEGVYLICDGDTISLNLRGTSTVLKVRKIDRLSAQVEIGTLGKTIIVR